MTNRRRTPGNPALVEIDSPSLALIRAEAQRSCDGLETGGILLGALDPNRRFKVRRAGDPGPAAVREPRYFLRDLAHAQALADAAWRQDRSQWIGEWHTHPHGPGQPSPTDLATYRQLLDDPELGFAQILSLIVAPDRAAGWLLFAWAVDRYGVAPSRIVLV